MTTTHNEMIIYEVEPKDLLEFAYVEEDAIHVGDVIDMIEEEGQEDEPSA